MKKKLTWQQAKEAESFLDHKFNTQENVVKISKANTFRHELSKYLLSWEALHNDETFVTEAIFKNGKRADLFIKNDCVAREVVCSETQKSKDKKRKEYPVDVVFFEADNVINIMLKQHGIIK